MTHAHMLVPIPTARLPLGGSDLELMQRAGAHTRQRAAMTKATVARHISGTCHRR